MRSRKLSLTASSTLDAPVASFVTKDPRQRLLRKPAAPGMHIMLPRPADRVEPASRGPRSNYMIRKGLMTCILAGTLAAGVGLAKVHVTVGIAPPAPIVETPPPSPGFGYVWTPGYYNWNGGSYVWVNGAWAVPPGHHHRYVAGAWVHHRHGWYLREGRWR